MLFPNAVYLLFSSGPDGWVRLKAVKERSFFLLLSQPCVQTPEGKESSPVSPTERRSVLYRDQTTQYFCLSQ